MMDYIQGTILLESYDCKVESFSFLFAMAPHMFVCVEEGGGANRIFTFNRLKL